MANQIIAFRDTVTREIIFERSGVASVELDGGLWTVVFKMPQYFGQKGSLPLTNANYAVTVNYSQNNPLFNDDGYTDHIDTIEVIEDASWEDGKYAQFEWTPPAEASLKNGWLYFNIRIRDRQTNGVWSTKTKKIRVNPVVTGGSSSSLTPSQSDKIDELLDAYPVAYGKEQSLSAEEKYRARTNIDAFGSDLDPVPIRLRAEKRDLDETVGYVNFLRGPSPKMLSADFGSFNKPLAEIAMRIYQGSPVQLVINSGDNRTILPDICTSDYSLGNPESVVFYPTSVTGSNGPTGDWYPDDTGMLLYSEDDPTLSVRFECHDPIVYKNVAVAKYKEYTYTPRESSTSITENLLVVEFSHEDLESAVVTVSGTNNSVASMNAFEIFEAVQNGKNVVLHWPMPNFDDGYYSCKLENSYKVGTSQAHAWFTTIIGNDLHWYTIDGDGNARASTVVPLGGGGSGSSVVKNLVIVDESGSTPIASMTSAQIKDIYDLGGTVILRYKDSIGSVVDYLLKRVYTDSQGSVAEFYDTWTFKTSDYTHIFVDLAEVKDNGEVSITLGGKISLPNPDVADATGKVLMSNGVNYYLASIPELSSDQMYDYIVESSWWDEEEDGDRAHFYAAMASAAKRSGDPRLPVITDGTNGYVVKVYNGNYHLLPDAGGGSGGAVNSVNGQTPDETGDIKLTIPSKTSQLTNDSKYVKENEVLSIVDTEADKRKARAAALNENEKVVSLSTRADLGSLISGNQWKQYKTDGGYYAGAVFYNPDNYTSGGSSADLIRLDKGYFIGVCRGSLFPSPEGLIDYVFLSYPDLEPIYAYDPEDGVFYPAGSLADETIEAAQADAEEFLTWLDSNSDSDYKPVIRDVADPVLDSDVATKGYVDNRNVRIVIADNGSLPTEYPTVNAILSEIRAGRSVVGYWWMTDHHLDDESYVLLYPTEPTLGPQATLELTGTYWHGTQRRMVIMSGQGTDDTLTISFVDIPSNNKERDSQIVTPSGNVPTTETTIYTHTITNAGHYLITANACGQYTSTTVDRALTLTIKVNGTVKAQTISTSASSWYAEGALSINEELSKNDVVTVTVLASRDSLAVKGVWHAGICQLC